MPKPIETNAVLKKWQLSKDETTVVGLIYGDKADIYVDGSIYKSVMVKSIIHYADYYIIKTIAYTFMCKLEDRLEEG